MVTKYPHGKTIPKKKIQEQTKGNRLAMLGLLYNADTNDVLNIFETLRNKEGKTIQTELNENMCTWYVNQLFIYAKEKGWSLRNNLKEYWGS